MRSMSASVRPALASATFGRRHRPDAHHVGGHPGHRPRHQAHQRCQTEFARPSPAWSTRHIDAASFCPLELPAVTVASGSDLPRTGFSCRELLHRGVGAGMLVGVDEPPDHACRVVRNQDGDDLLGEQAVLLGRDRPLVRAHRELVLFLARDPVLPAQVLGRLEHAARHRVVPAARGGAPAGQRVVHRDAASGAAPTHVRRVEHDVAHPLGAAGDDEFVVAAG